MDTPRPQGDVSSAGPLGSYEAALRRLAIGEPTSLDEALCDGATWAGRCGLDSWTVSLVRIAAIVAAGADVAALQLACNEAAAQGATSQQMLGVLVAVAPLTGTVRLMSAAPLLGLALGVDIEAALEAIDSED